MRALMVAAIVTAVASSGCGDSLSQTARSSGQSTATGAATSNSPTSLVSNDAGAAVSAPDPAGGPARLVLDDPPADVSLSLNDGDNATHSRRHPKADLRRVTLTYEGGAVEVAERIGDLRPTGFQTFVVQLRGPQLTLYGYAIVQDRRAAPYVDWELSSKGAPSDESPRSINCPNASVRADFGRNLMLFVVPSTCLGAPPWIRLGASNEFLGPGDEIRTDELNAAQMKRDFYSARVYAP